MGGWAVSLPLRGSFKTDHPFRFETIKEVRHRHVQDSRQFEELRSGNLPSPLHLRDRLLGQAAELQTEGLLAHVKDRPALAELFSDVMCG